MNVLVLLQRWPGHRRTNSTQSVSLDPVSPTSPSFGSVPDFSSYEDSRRISVTSPFDRRSGSTEAPLVRPAIVFSFMFLYHEICKMSLSYQACPTVNLDMRYLLKLSDFTMCEKVFTQFNYFCFITRLNCF